LGSEGHSESQIATITTSDHTLLTTRTTCAACEELGSIRSFARVVYSLRDGGVLRCCALAVHQADVCSNDVHARSPVFMIFCRPQVLFV
jgi:hypothetical protein